MAVGTPASHDFKNFDFALVGWTGEIHAVSLYGSGLPENGMIGQSAVQCFRSSQPGFRIAGSFPGGTKVITRIKRSYDAVLIDDFSFIEIGLQSIERREEYVIPGYVSGGVSIIPRFGIDIPQKRGFLLSEFTDGRIFFRCVIAESHGPSAADIGHGFFRNIGESEILTEVGFEGNRVIVLVIHVPETFHHAGFHPGDYSGVVDAEIERQ